MKDIMGNDVILNDTVVYSYGNHINYGTVVDITDLDYNKYCIIQVEDTYIDGTPWQYKLRAYPLQILVKK